MLILAYKLDISGTACPLPPHRSYRERRAALIATQGIGLGVVDEAFFFGSKVTFRQLQLIAAKQAMCPPDGRRFTKN